MSWHPDPGASFIDAFSMSWTDKNFYAFPPFSLISRCIQKVIHDRAQGIMITPLWPTQVWFPQLLEVVDILIKPIVLPQSRTLLTLVGLDRVHPMWQTMHLVAWRVSGRPSSDKDFQVKPPISLWTRGGNRPRNNIWTLSQTVVYILSGQEHLSSFTICR